jgi:MoxR-like ATPase
MNSPAKLSPQKVLEQWYERDLSAEAAYLPQAFELDGKLEHAAGILASGRSLLLIGDAGVGKTALVVALARALPELETLDALGRPPVIQLSVGLRLSRLRKSETIFEAFAGLMDALPRLDAPIIPFFRDGDLLYQTGIAAQLDSFCMRVRVPVIVEGRPGAMSGMLEVFEELEQHFVSLPMEEPDVARALRILEGWAADGNATTAGGFSAAALEEAVYLSHRFLARTRLPRKAIDLLRATSTGSDTLVDADAVIERFCRVHHTPRWLVDPGVAIDLGALEDRLREALLGQDEAVAAALSTISLVKAGLSDMRRPFGVFLFVGPTGVGKTHLAQMLAAELFGAPERMVRINMGDFAGPRGAEALFGDPEHHLVANRRGVLTQRLTGRAFGVVLLDEFEKADRAVHDRLLPLVDEGSFVNGAGEPVSCRSSIIIATSNAGAEVYRESALGFTTPCGLDARREELEQRIKQVFRFELLNRFDRVVHFHPLSRDEIRELAARELRALERRPGLRRMGTRLRVDESVLDWLAARGYDARYGARFLKRTIEREVTTALAAELARAPAPRGAALALEVRRGRIRARADDDTPLAPASVSVEAGRPGSRLPGLSAAALLERAATRLQSLARDVVERDRLLSEMSEEAFWDDAPRRDEVTERFRALDVATRLAQRSARPLEELRDSLERGEEPAPSAVEDAAQALLAWEQRDRMEGLHRLWLLLSGAEPHTPPRDWMLALARMLMAWCRRSELRVGAAAFEPRTGDQLSRLVLDVEGPGAEYFLAPERGIHRQRRHCAPDARVRVDLVAQASDGFGVDVRDRALVRGPFGLMADLECTLALEHTGQVVTLAGAGRSTLAGLAGDLQAAWSGLRLESPELARSYGEPGGLAVDPRTGASGRVRSVTRGQLDVFHAALRERSGATRERLPG